MCGVMFHAAGFLECYGNHSLPSALVHGIDLYPAIGPSIRRHEAFPMSRGRDVRPVRVGPQTLPQKWIPLGSRSIRIQIPCRLVFRSYVDLATQMGMHELSASFLPGPPVFRHAIRSVRITARLCHLSDGGVCDTSAT